MKSTSKLDPECINLVTILNKCAGVRTFYSCCGHGKSPFIIKFVAERLNSIYPIVTASDGESGGPTWACFVESYSYRGKTRLTFVLTSPSDVLGEKAYKEADTIALGIINLLNDEQLCNKYGYHWADKGSQLQFDFMSAG